MKRILVVDDNAAMREQYAYDLGRLGGFDTLTASDGQSGLEILDRESIDCVILDLEMPGMDGFDVLERLAQGENTIPVIVYTGTGNFERCVRAVRLGAYSFVDKSEPTERVVNEIRNALRRGRLEAEVRQLRRQVTSETPLVGESPPMRRLREAIHRVAVIPSPVLVLGESGSGKELVARELHDLSPWRDGPFIAVNCAALPTNLIESELFGHERGAFTGADRLRIGSFERATGGTLFLDEVAELPPEVQAKLLRVMEQRQIVRVGANEPLEVTARVVAATHRDLDQRIRDDQFREDLYYRINVHTLRVPPLRDRMEDLPLLVFALLEGICERFGVPRPDITKEAIHTLAGYDWSRNNVRELRNSVERMVIAAGEGPIRVEHVPAEVLDAELLGIVYDDPESGMPSPSSEPKVVVQRDSDQDDAVGTSGEEEIYQLEGTVEAPKNLRDLRDAAERAIILRALERNDGHLTKTAEELGLSSHSSLRKIMRRHGL